MRKKEAKDRVLEIYFDELRRTPLLNAEEEVQLAKEIEAGKIAKEELEKANQPDFPAAELRAIVEVGEDAARHLAKANLKLVISIAKKYFGRTLNLTRIGLIQAGNRGLMEAVHRFDWRLGFRFSTFATYWIMQSTRLALLSDKSKFISLDAEIKMGEHGNREHETFYDMLEDTKSNTPSRHADMDLLRSSLLEALLCLGPTHRKIMTMRFGLFDGCLHSTKEIADFFHLSQERVRQIIRKSLKKLKNHEKISGLEHLIS